MQRAYKVFLDKRGSWLRVRRSELHRLGIAHLISVLSYQRGDWIYLDNDGDAGAFVTAKRARDEPVDTRIHRSERMPSRIRLYECYRQEKDI